MSEINCHGENSSGLISRDEAKQNKIEKELNWMYAYMYMNMLYMHKKSFLPFLYLPAARITNLLLK